MTRMSSGQLSADPELVDYEECVAGEFRVNFARYSGCKRCAVKWRLAESS